MDLKTSELFDLARERGSSFVAIATPPEVIKYSWDSTDARWEELLDFVGKFSKVQPYILWVGVVTEGVTVDNQTYEMKEHLNITVLTPEGYECYCMPLYESEDAVVSLGELPPEEFEFDLEALKAALPQSS